MYPLTIGLVISSSRLWEEGQSALRELPVRIVMEQATIQDVSTFLEKVERFHPDVVLLDPTQLNVDLSDLISGLKATSAQPFVIVVRETAEPDEILRAVRAGANEYIYSPIAVALQEALERLSRQRELKDTPKVSRSKVIGFLSAKGGCGATTIACHAAVDLARMSSKATLLADFDFTAGVIRVLMQAKSRYSVMDVMSNIQRLDQSFWKAVVSNGYDGVEVIAGPVTEFPKEAPKTHEVRHVIRFARSQYDYLLLDLGRGMDPAIAGAVEELDELILVTTPELPALQVTKLIVKHLTGIGFRHNRIRVVLNRMSRRVEFSLEEIESAIGVDVYATVPNDYGALERAYFSGRILPEGSNVRDAIDRLMCRLLEVQPPEERKRRFSLFG